MPFTLAVDLAFELERSDQATVHGRLTSEGDQLVLEVSDPGAFAGGADAPSIRAIAESLATQKVVVRVVHDGRHLVSLGAVAAPWWQRRLTGSRRIRIASVRGAWTSARAQARARRSPPTLPAVAMLPPLPLFPLAPTLVPRRRRRVTTTHDPAQGGGPRLVLLTTGTAAARRAPVYWLQGDTTIGSSPACQVVLDGLEPIHARIRHDDADEWVVEAVAGVTRVHGGAVVRQRLRTGSMLQVGAYRLAFFREEYADHGRPYGGRTGGELGRNTAQPERATGSAEDH